MTSGCVAELGLCQLGGEGEEIFMVYFNSFADDNFYNPYCKIALEDKRMKKRCSIAWCPWKAKHYFTGGYQECWFHYEEMPLINWAWELLNYPIRKFFFWIRFIKQV